MTSTKSECLHSSCDHTLWHTSNSYCENNFIRYLNQAGYFPQKKRRATHWYYLPSYFNKNQSRISGSSHSCLYPFSIYIDIRIFTLVDNFYIHYILTLIFAHCLDFLDIFTTTLLLLPSDPIFQTVNSEDNISPYPIATMARSFLTSIQIS